MKFDFKFVNFVYLLFNEASGICHLAQAVKGNVDDLLKGVGDKNAIEEVKHILEMVICYPLT